MQVLRSALASLVLLLLAGCPSTEPTPVDDDDSAVSDGRVQVVGTGFYDTIQEAVDAAPTGGTILLGAGCYDEAVVINKPLSLSGDSSNTTVISGGGAGTVITIDGVATGSVTLNSLLVRVPHDEPATLRAVRVTDSSDVLLHDVELGFETALAPDAVTDYCQRIYLPEQTTGDCDRGLLGLDVSQSTVLVSQTTVACVGYTSDTGGTGILAQTGSELTVSKSTIQGVGSFGIRVIDTSLTVDDLSIVGVNRNSSAQDFESNGSAIFVEGGAAEVVASGLSVDNGVFVGLWMESPTLTVTDSTFTGFNYGIYMPGDPSSASGRHLTVTSSSFVDLRTEAILATASSSILGSEFAIDTLLPASAGGTLNSGVRLLGAGTTQEVSNNTFDGFGTRALGIYGSNVDGNVASATVEANTVTGTIGGNGIDVQFVDSAAIRANVIDGVDHEYNNDPNNPGAISSGFGIDCFFVDDCQLEGNTVIGAEFGDFVLVGSSFDSVGDTARDGLGRGFHIETSQGTFTDPTIVDQRGFGILAVDSTIQGTGGTVANTLRGPAIQDIDGNDDPLPGDLQYTQGGVALWAVSQGAPAFLSWEGGTFASSASGAVTTQDSQVQLIGNTFLDSGFVDENGYYPSSAIFVSGNDPQALSGPIFANNVVDGGEGSWGAYFANVPGLQFSGNTLCAGTFSGLYLSESDGAVVRDSSFGTSDDPTVAACDSTTWVRAIDISELEPAGVLDGISLSNLTLAAPDLGTGINLLGLGTYTLDGVTISGATTAGVNASMTLPSGLSSDLDGDGQSRLAGDCDDGDPSVGGSGATEVPGDGRDNDCDGVTDDGTSTEDADGDGASIADGDCDDGDAAVHPGAVEDVLNLRDDNCDGLADLDGAYPLPVLRISGTTIDGPGDALWLSGVTAELLEPAFDGDPINQLSSSGARGSYVAGWTWGGTPLSSEGALVMGPSTRFGPTQANCISLSSLGASATLSGATLSDCGAHGLSVGYQASADLQGVTIVSPGLSGVYQDGGILLASNLTVTGPGQGGVTVAGADADATIQGLVVLGGVAAVNQLQGALVVEDLMTDGTASDAVSVSGGVTSLVNPSIAGAGNDGLVVTGGTVTVLGGEVGTVDEDGVSVSGVGTLIATDLSVSGPSGRGLAVDGGAATWTGGSIAGTGGSAVVVSGGQVELSDLAVTAPGAAGLVVSGGTLSVSGGSVSGAAMEGVAATGGTLTLDGVVVDGSGSDGVALAGDVAASVLDGDLSDNGGFGLLCDGGAADLSLSTVALSACEAVTSNNSDGAFELVGGCELIATCGAPTP